MNQSFLPRGLFRLAALSLALAVHARAGSLQNGLVAHLSFDNTLQDNSGESNNAVKEGSPGFGPGEIGSALAYTTLAGGTSFNYASLPAANGLVFGATTNFTVAFWVNFTNNTGDLPFLANKNWNTAANVGWAVAMQDNGSWQWSLEGAGSGSSPAGYADSTFLRDGAWHHLAVTFNRQANASAYVDGVLVNQTSISASAGSIDTGYPVNVGQDGTGTYTGLGQAQAVNARIDDLGIWTRELSALEIGRIQYAGQNGVAISAITDSSAPFIFSASPANGSVNASPAPLLSVSIQDAPTNTVNTNAIFVYVDGAAAVPTVQYSNGTTLVQYQPTSVFAPLTTHQYTLVYSDNNNPPDTSSNSFQFTVANYTNLVLPPPIVLETFNEVPPGSLPPGWTTLNNSDPSADPGSNLFDPDSDSYLNWVVISKGIVQSIEAAGIWEANNRLEVAPMQVVNGTLLTSLIETNFIYAESDTRIGNAIQYLFSPDYNLGGGSNLFISYRGIYEQSANNIGAIEYSTNQGASWLPVVYLLDGTAADQQIAYFTNGIIDAVTTFTNFNASLPIYQDPVSGNIYGGTYGSFIAAPVSQALAPYISPRTNGDPVSSKKVEVFPIPSANGQATVRFRFAQAGYGSWYFGIDDFGIYAGAATVVTTPLAITHVSVANNSVSLAWSGGASPHVVQSNTRLGTTNWVNVATNSAGAAVVPATGSQTFFRIVSQGPN